jgi:hypothetical protein
MAGVAARTVEEAPELAGTMPVGSVALMVGPKMRDSQRRTKSPSRQDINLRKFPSKLVAVLVSSVSAKLSEMYNVKM